MSGDATLSYHGRLAAVASWYRDHADPDGGWPMHWRETPAGRRPSLIGTAYGLAVVRYARTPVADENVQRALRFALDPVRTWSSTRHPVYTILAATEWPEALTDGGMGNDAAITAAHVHGRVRDALDWLTRERAGAGWPGSPGGHICVPWTAKVLYALGRLRSRGNPYSSDEAIVELIRNAADLLSDGNTGGERFGAWPFCGGMDRPSVAVTSLAVIALSHRGVETAGTSDQQQHWREAYHAGAGWLLDHHHDWERSESGEHDPVADDDWQFALWSLAPRACLSAGTDPSHPNLAPGIRFAFDRWRGGNRPGWYVLGKGVSGYSNWSVVQLGQAIKLAISRLDPQRVITALQEGPTAHEIASDVTVLLDPDARVAQLVRANGDRATMNLNRQEKRFKLLHAFAERNVPAGGALDADTLQRWVNKAAGADLAHPWQALKALAHQTNEAARKALHDPTVQLLRATTRGKQQAIVITARCTLQHTEIETGDSNPEDVTGISATTGESY